RQLHRNGRYIQPNHELCAKARRHSQISSGTAADIQPFAPCSNTKTPEQSDSHLATCPMPPVIFLPPCLHLIRIGSHRFLTEFRDRLSRRQGRCSSTARAQL